MEKSLFMRIITIILAILILAIVLISLWSDWGIKEKILETLNQAEIERKVESICPKERQSPETVFLQINGDCGACTYYNPADPDCNPFCNDRCTGLFCCQDDRNETEIGKMWECDAPEGGECIVTKMSHYQWVYNGCEERFWVWINGIPIPITVPIEEFTDYKIYENSMAGTLLYESYKYCMDNTDREGLWSPCCGDKCKYWSSVSPVLENSGVFDAEQNLYFYRKFVMAREYDNNPDFTECEGRNFVKEDEEFHHYELKVAGRYCCAEGKKWNKTRQDCCAEDDCIDLDCEQKGGTWVYGECWFFGNPMQNCDQACADNGLTCKNPDWATIPKDCALHDKVLDDQDIVNSRCFTCTGSNSLRAPFTDLSLVNKQCFYKDDYTQTYECGGALAPVRRICACQV